MWKVWENNYVTKKATITQKQKKNIKQTITLFTTS